MTLVGVIKFFYHNGWYFQETHINENYRYHIGHEVGEIIHNTYMFNGYEYLRIK